jgi:hypothetical protein
MGSEACNALDWGGDDGGLTFAITVFEAESPISGSHLGVRLVSHWLAIHVQRSVREESVEVQTGLKIILGASAMPKPRAVSSPG